MYASSSLSSSLHKIVLKIERSQITVTAAQFVFKCKWLSYQRPRFSHLTVWRGTRLATATTNEAWSLHPDLTPPPPHSFLSQVQDRKDLEKMHNHCTYGYVFSSPKTFCLWDQSGCSARSRVKNRNSQGQGFFYAKNKTKIKQKTKTKRLINEQSRLFLRPPHVESCQVRYDAHFKLQRKTNDFFTRTESIWCTHE